MSELDHFEIAHVPDNVEWEHLISSWSVCSQNILIEEFRRAKLLFTAHKRWGREGMLSFAHEVGCEKSSAYDRLRLWRFYGQAIEDGNPLMSSRLENYGLDISHWIASTYDDAPVEILDEAEDAALPVRAMVKKIHERKEAKAIEEAKAAGFSVEVVDAPPDEDAPGRQAVVELKAGVILCPRCAGTGVIEGESFLKEGRGD